MEAKDIYIVCRSPHVPPGVVKSQFIATGRQINALTKMNATPVAAQMAKTIQFIVEKTDFRKILSYRSSTESLMRVTKVSHSISSAKDNCIPDQSHTLTSQARGPTYHVELCYFFGSVFCLNIGGVQSETSYNNHYQAGQKRTTPSGRGYPYC